MPSFFISTTKLFSSFPPPYLSYTVKERYTVITLPFLSLPQKDLFCCSWARNPKSSSQLPPETRASARLLNSFSPGPERGYGGQPHRPRPGLPGGGQQHAERSPNQPAPCPHSPRGKALLPGHPGLPPGWSRYAHTTSDISWVFSCSSSDATSCKYNYKADSRGRFMSRAFAYITGSKEQFHMFRFLPRVRWEDRSQFSCLCVSV